MSHVTKLIQETPLADKPLGRVNWLEVRFEFDNPRLASNNYPPPAQQLMWGTMVQGNSTPWYITQKSVEKLLNAIGPKAGTVVKVAKIRTGPQPKEIEYEIEYVSGTTDPRDIRAELEAQQPQSSQAPVQQQQGSSPVPPQNSQRPPGQERVYTRTSQQEIEVWEARFTDNADLYMAGFNIISDLAPDDWSIEDIRQVATGVGIETNRQVGKFGGLGGWSVEATPEPLPPVPEMNLDQLHQAAMELTPLPVNQFVAELKELLTEAHPHAKDPKHTRNIITNKLGYENISIQEDVLSSLIHEFMVYCDARDQGLDDVNACILVADECGRDKGLMPPIVNREAEQDKEAAAASEEPIAL